MAASAETLAHRLADLAASGNTDRCITLEGAEPGEWMQLVWKTVNLSCPLDTLPPEWTAKSAAERGLSLSHFRPGKVVTFEVSSDDPFVYAEVARGLCRDVLGCTFESLRVASEEDL